MSKGKGLISGGDNSGSGMPPRTRRTAAVAAAAAAAAAALADMQEDSDVEMEEEEVDVEGGDEEGEDEEGEEEEEGEADGEAEPDADDDDLVLPQTSRTTSAQPRLKITLKLPVNHPAASSNSGGTATPDELDFLSYKRTPRRRAKARVIQDVDVESEDPSSASASEVDQSALETPSRSTGTPTGGAKPMTTRQAVLASVVDSSHVSLNEGSKSKKQPLNETELALRREETARKRRNLSEKKLEDEKAETINRLLKKQSRPRAKRNNAIDDRSPMPSAKPKTIKNNEEGEEAEGDEDDEEMEAAEPVEEAKPMMYRWVSTIRDVSLTASETEQKGKGRDDVSMKIMFSVPEALLSSTPSSSDAGTSMEVDDQQRAELAKINAARGPGVCAVAGCGKPRKYRVPKDWTVGACDMGHLKIVAGTV